MSSLAQIADLQMYVYAFERNRWQDFENAWLSILLWYDRRLWVAKKGECDQMYFPTTSLGGVASIGWPGAQRL